MRDQLKFYTLICAIIAVICAVIWWGTRPEPWEQGQIASGVRGIDKVDLTVPSVKVYDKKAKKALKLPPDVQADTNKHVISASDCGDRTAVTIIDQRTGETELLVQTKPLPWIARENSVEVRLAHGLRGGEQMTRFSGSWALLQTKALHWGAVGTLDADGQNFIGGEVKFKF